MVIVDDKSFEMIIDSLNRMHEKQDKFGGIQQQVLQRLKYVNGDVGDLKEFKEGCPVRREKIMKEITQINYKALGSIISVGVLIIGFLINKLFFT